MRPGSIEARALEAAARLGGGAPEYLQHRQIALSLAGVARRRALRRARRHAAQVRAIWFALGAVVGAALALALT